MPMVRRKKYLMPRLRRLLSKNLLPLIPVTAPALTVPPEMAVDVEDVALIAGRVVMLPFATRVM